MRGLLIVMSMMLLPLAACEGTASSGGHDLARAVEGHGWLATTIGGKQVIAGTSVTLKIEGGRVGGKAGCNGYGGPVEILDDRITFGSLFSTEMACVANGVMEQEQRYLSLLQGATRGDLSSDGALTITTPGGTLEFRPE